MELHQQRLDNLKKLKQLIDLGFSLNMLAQNIKYPNDSSLNLTQKKEVDSARTTIGKMTKNPENFVYSQSPLLVEIHNFLRRNFVTLNNTATEALSTGKMYRNLWQNNKQAMMVCQMGVGMYKDRNVANTATNKLLTKSDPNLMKTGISMNGAQYIYEQWKRIIVCVGQPIVGQPIERQPIERQPNVGQPTMEQPTGRNAPGKRRKSIASSSSSTANKRTKNNTTVNEDGSGGSGLIDFGNIHEDIEKGFVNGKGAALIASKAIKRGTVLGLMHGVHLTKDVYESIQTKNLTEKISAFEDDGVVEMYALGYILENFPEAKHEIMIVPIFEHDVTKQDTAYKLDMSYTKQKLFLINEPSQGRTANSVFMDVSQKAPTKANDNHAQPNYITVGVCVVMCKDVSRGDEITCHYGNNRGVLNYQRGKGCQNILHFYEHPNFIQEVETNFAAALRIPDDAKIENIFGTVDGSLNIRSAQEIATYDNYVHLSSQFQGYIPDPGKILVGSHEDMDVIRTRYFTSNISSMSEENQSVQENQNLSVQELLAPFLEDGVIETIDELDLVQELNHIFHQYSIIPLGAR